MAPHAPPKVQEKLHNEVTDKISKTMGYGRKDVQEALDADEPSAIKDAYMIVRENKLMQINRTYMSPQSLCLLCSFLLYLALLRYSCSAQLSSARLSPAQFCPTVHASSQTTLTRHPQPPLGPDNPYFATSPPSDEPGMAGIVAGMSTLGAEADSGASLLTSMSSAPLHRLHQHQRRPPAPTCPRSASCPAAYPRTTGTT